MSLLPPSSSRHLFFQEHFMLLTTSSFDFFVLPLSSCSAQRPVARLAFFLKVCSGILLIFHCSCLSGLSLEDPLPPIPCCLQDCLLARASGIEAICLPNELPGGNAGASLRSRSGCHPILLCACCLGRWCHHSRPPSHIRVMHLGAFIPPLSLSHSPPSSNLYSALLNVC